MSNILNFNNVTKQYLTITFADEKNTTIMVGTPTKALLRELVDLEKNIRNIDPENNFGALDELYSVCAKIMSRNKTGFKVTKEFLEENLDFEDSLIFLKGYMSFVSRLSKQKN